jgi:hypothetical protein
MEQRPEITERKATTILLQRGGLEGKKKIRPPKKCFSLDSFYRTNQMGVSLAVFTRYLLYADLSTSNGRHV